MKIKNILVSLVAILALAAGCDQIEPDHFLDEVKVSSSYVPISMNGGSATFQIETTDSWNITGAPSWLTVSPAAGSAGSSTVTLSAPSTLDGRTAELVINCGGKTQNINVIQGLAVVSPATCAEIIAGPDSKTYRVTGICTAIANTNYGNWYLQDATGQIYIYGTVDSKGSYNWNSFGIEVGDEVTVEGPKTTYNGTVELVDVSVIKVNKSLIKVAEIDPEDGVFPTEGGDMTVKLTNKGNGIYVEVPENAKSWLSIASVSGNTVVFHAAENTAGPRNATLVIKTTDGKKSYSCETSVMQLGASGSQELPFTVEEAIAYALSVGAETASDFYVKGIVSKIEDNGAFGSHGNSTFWISDDGTYYNDKAKDFEAYRVYWLGNEKWTEGNAQIAVGTEVILCGHFTVYKGTAETYQNKAYVYRINGVKDDSQGIGTLDDPFTPEGAIVACNAIGGPSSFNAYVKGKISQIVNNGQFSAQHGNATFFISDNGTYYDDKSKDFEAYRVYYLGNKKWEEGNDQIAVGDDVVIYGQLTLYKGTGETNQNKAWIYSHNGKTE